MYKKNNKRFSFASSKLTAEYPDFLDIQIKSFQDFFNLRLNLQREQKKGYSILLKKIFQ